MTATPPGMAGHVAGFIDIGTNSVRLLVVRINPDHSFSVLSRQKQQVRLGEGEYDDEEIRPEAMDRTVVVCKNFVDLARSHGCEEFVAVATSATREAVNQTDLLNRLRHEAQLDVRVISGREEARLIYLGVASATNLDGEQALFIDIGGGSTELAVGDRHRYQYLESLKLGAIRLTNQYFGADETGPVSADTYRKIQQHVRNATIHAVQKIRKHRIDRVIGSSGTIVNLAEIVQRARNPHESNRNGSFSYKDLKKVIGQLASLPLDARRRVPGINPDRADIIVAGAAILDVLMKELDLAQVAVTNRGLQDGLLADYISRMDKFPLFGELSVRQRSVLQLGRSCGINEAHARTVTALALGLFDSAKVRGLHALGEPERELLEYATFLHDIGSFISYTNHHAHSFYIISHAELLGFDQQEIAVMANIARFHRKKAPHKRNADLVLLDQKMKDTVLVLSTLLRFAESLDRSHAALVCQARFSRADRKTAVLCITSRGDCQLELWGVEGEKKAFERVFGRSLVLELEKGSPGLAG